MQFNISYCYWSYVNHYPLLDFPNDIKNLFKKFNYQVLKHKISATSYLILSFLRPLSKPNSVFHSRLSYELTVNTLILVIYLDI